MHNLSYAIDRYLAPPPPTQTKKYCDFTKSDSELNSTANQFPLTAKSEVITVVLLLI
jgi:hypothetical protein